RMPRSDGSRYVSPSTAEGANAALVNVVDASIGLFAAGGLGYGPAVAKNVISDTEQADNAPQTPAQPGQTVIVRATGLGAVAYADNTAPTPEDLAGPVQIFVGGKPATRRSPGRS